MKRKSIINICCQVVTIFAASLFVDNKVNEQVLMSIIIVMLTAIYRMIDEKE